MTFAKLLAGLLVLNEVRGIATAIAVLPMLMHAYGTAFRHLMGG